MANSKFYANIGVNTGYSASKKWNNFQKKEDNRMKNFLKSKCIFSIFLSFNVLILDWWVENFSGIYVPFIITILIIDIIECLIIMYLTKKYKFSENIVVSYFLFILNVKINKDLLIFLAPALAGF